MPANVRTPSIRCLDTVWEDDVLVAVVTIWIALVASSSPMAVRSASERDTTEALKASPPATSTRQRSAV